MNLINPFIFMDEDGFVPIINFDTVKNNMYAINYNGIVKNIHTNKILSTVYNKNNGYMNVLLQTSNGSKPILIHRLVAHAFCPNLYDKPMVNHIDGNKLNNNYLNLEWCTAKENTVHAINMGLSNIKGENNTSAKLTNNQVHQICKLLQDNKYTYSQILEIVGIEVTKQNLDIITKIRTKKLWRIISDLYNIPEKEYRGTFNVYTDEQIHNICNMIQSGYSNRDIALYLNIDMDNKNDSDKFYKFIMRIRRRETYTHISNNYNW